MAEGVTVLPDEQEQVMSPNPSIPAGQDQPSHDVTNVPDVVRHGACAPTTSLAGETSVTLSSVTLDTRQLPGMMTPVETNVTVDGQRAGPSRPSRSGLDHDNLGFTMDENLDYTLAPPTYDEVINSTRFPLVRTGPRDAGEGFEALRRLDFVDFTPNINQAERNQGDFRTLLKRANAWLNSNRDIELRNCETVTWSSTSLSQMHNTDVVHRSKSLTSSLKTRYLRGLRLWFVPLTRVNCEMNSEELTVNVVDFVPESSSDTILTLVKRANKQLKEIPIAGKILNMETVFTRTGRGKVYSNATMWAESPAKSREYAFFLRIVYIVGIPQREEIGIQDFLPEQRSNSYENFSQVMEKSSNWVGGELNIRVTNMQAVFVKRKGTPEMSHNRCFYTEHAHKSECRITYFYQMLRTYYTKCQNGLSLIVHTPLQLTKKTFAPAMLPPIGDEREPRFESFTKTVERVSCWLDSTRAEVFCVETVPVRMHTGTQQRLGPEAALVWSQPEAGVRSEDWLLFVRVYVKGGYQELHVHHALSMPPIDWYRRQHFQPIRRPARRKRSCVVFCLIFLFLLTTSFVIVYIYMNILGPRMLH